MRIIPAAAGGPKGLVLNGLGRYLFGDWLPPARTRCTFATLPNAKLPDRNDFKAYGDDVAGRVAAWSRALRESQRLAHKFAAAVGSGRPIEALPLT
ncbi:MAG TPA: hypothetical protein VET87_17540 [Rubrivivax sp.]|nr:hypothetical protein [Rubrivivax sp.]